MSLNDWLRNLHPCPVEIVCDVSDWRFEIFLHSWPVRCLLLSTPGVSFFFRTFQVISDLPTLRSFKMAWFSPKDSSLLFMLVYLFLTQMQSSQAKPKVKTRTILESPRIPHTLTSPAERECCHSTTTSVPPTQRSHDPGLVRHADHEWKGWS